MSRFLHLGLAALALGVGLALLPGASSHAACPAIAATGPDSGLGGTGAEDPDSGLGGTGAEDPDSGLGGTGIAATDSGLGGTGAEDPDSGLGGTGIAATDSGLGGTGAEDPDSGLGGTGIFGTITGFASVCINGLEVHYGTDVPVTENGEASTIASLAVGQVAWIVAEAGDNGLVARSITLLSAAIGPVANVAGEPELFRVNGQTIEIPAAVLAPAQRAGLLEPGTRIDVSGLRRPDGRVIASRISPAGPRPLGAPMPSVDALVRTTPDLGRLSIQGFAGRRVGPERFELDGFEVNAGVELPRGAGPELRLTVEGPVRDGVLDAKRLEIAPPAPDRPEVPPVSDPRPTAEFLKPQPVSNTKPTPRGARHEK